MGAEGTLQRRMVTAHAALALAVCGLFAFAAFVGIEQIEAYIVHRRLDLVMQWETERPPGAPAAALPPGLDYYGPEALTSSMRELASGFHQDTRGAITAYTLVYDDAKGQRHVAVDTVPDFELIERDIAIALAIGTALSVLLAAALGRLVAGRVVAPLTALAKAVDADRLDPQAPALQRGDEIGRLGRAFAARAAQLRAFLERERAFSGDISHELRTPVTVISGASELLATQLATRPEALRTVERIRRTAAEMADRIGALLLLSRSPEAIPTPVIELRAIAEREVERCRPLLAGKAVTLELDAPVTVQCPAHEELVAVALGNLLRNACRYTEAGQVRVVLRPDGLVVEDSGPGLPSEVRSRLFTRVDPAPRDGEGSGFGLALVKRIVDRLGWTISHEDAPAGGSRFIVGFGVRGAG